MVTAKNKSAAFTICNRVRGRLIFTLISMSVCF